LVEAGDRPNKEDPNIAQAVQKTGWRFNFKEDREDEVQGDVQLAGTRRRHSYADNPYRRQRQAGT
jgi:hypothetical protein